jgi:hypothetical protein
MNLTGTSAKIANQITLLTYSQQKKIEKRELWTNAVMQTESDVQHKF